MKSNCKHDQTTSKKAFANLVTISSFTPDRDCCCIDVCAEKGNTGIVATTFNDISFANQIDRLFKF